MDEITKSKRNKRKSQRKEKELIEIQGLSKIGSFKHTILTEEITGTPEFFKIMDLTLNSHFICLHFTKSYPEDLKEFKENVKKSFKENTEFYFRIKTSKGHDKCIKAKTTLKYSEEGKPLNVVGYVHDITELKI